ncbi:uncharacterized protein LOC101853461 [Aplysia californica]|uniref:Uncharacterized protein LOC101853461 n=1 Tax=Aplysia californica TaxID=6500 RepID=A0ABM1A037_APLCA|nr:uncharacterized protein LOC101853461 [Aplysia californica]
MDSKGENSGSGDLAAQTSEAGEKIKDFDDLRKDGVDLNKEYFDDGSKVLNDEKNEDFDNKSKDSTDQTRENSNVETKEDKGGQTKEEKSGDQIKEISVDLNKDHALGQIKENFGSLFQDFRNQIKEDLGEQAKRNSLCAVEAVVENPAVSENVGESESCSKDMAADGVPVDTAGDMSGAVGESEPSSSPKDVDISVISDVDGKKEEEGAEEVQSKVDEQAPPSVTSCPALSKLAAGHMTHEQLQHHVTEQQHAMTRMQSHAHAQQVKANLLTTSLRAKLRRKEQELRVARAQNEQSVSHVVSRLLHLESRLQCERAEVLEALQEKDDVIRRQRAALEDLGEKNHRLLQALQETHGYGPDNNNRNGLVKSSEPATAQDGQYSIQDHGNKVILRGSKGRDKSGTPSSGHKVRFSNMKEKLRRHKSSLELYQSEPLETLFEGSLRYYGSQDNLIDGRSPGSRDPRQVTSPSTSSSRQARCRSLVEYPSQLREEEEEEEESQHSPDSCFEEATTSDLSRSGSINSSTSSLYNPRDSFVLTPSSLTSSSTSSSSYSSSSSSSSAYPVSSRALGFSELAKSRSVPQALPTVIENDSGGVGGISSGLKERPHSLPSVDLLAPDSPKVKVSMSPSVTPAAAAPVVTPVPVSSSPPESNPFKSIKNVFKRRGSKKKRSVSLGQSTNQEYHDAVKQHFKKYDLT